MDDIFKKIEEDNDKLAELLAQIDRDFIIILHRYEREEKLRLILK